MVSQRLTIMCLMPTILFLWAANTDSDVAMGLDVALIKAPSGAFLKENGDRYLGISFSNVEWENFFYDALGAPEPGPYIEGEGILAFDKRRRSSFHESLTRFPMLSRIHDYYEDVFYRPDEIPRLFEECLGVEGKTTNSEAKSFLDGMVYACKEAMQNNTGLFLAAD